MMATEPPQAESKAGLECPKCECAHWFVVKVEQRPRYIYRRKECRHCGHRITTTERVVG